MIPSLAHFDTAPFFPSTVHILLPLTRRRDERFEIVPDPSNADQLLGTRTIGVRSSFLICPQIVLPFS